MSSKRTKSSRKQQEDSQERLIVDPYETIATPASVCNFEDHTRKKNCAKNPWCVYGLGEKEGIWRSTNAIINSLGPDPNNCLRSCNVKGTDIQTLCPPAGLRNLGATCYLNVLIQSLFHNLLVQDAVFNMQADGPNASNETGNKKPAPQNEMLPVILALQSSFAHMKLCHNSVVDLTRFVELLGLNKSTQQDPQEFNKLFFAKIESANLSTREPARASFNDLLSGRVKYSTRCNGCGQERVPPEHPFHELDLSIEGVSTVEEALANYTAIEHLTGENQYECATCQGRRDAQRCTIILKAPTVLNLHLLRYGYDRETYERKKLTSEVTFQDIMEVCGERFKLVSVLYHKGRSAYGGHYVCDALDWRTGEWWHYDDDTVCATTNPSLNMNPATSTNTTASTTTNSNTNIDSNNTKSSTTTTSNSHSHTTTETMCIDLVDTPTTTPSKSPRRSTTAYPTTSKTAPIALPIAVEDDNIEDTDPDEWIETKGKNKRTLGSANKKSTTSAAGAASSDGKSSAKGKGGNSRKKQAVEVDLTDSVDNAGAAGANKATKLGFNRKRDAYMFTYVKITAFTEALRTTRIEPSPVLIDEVQRTSDEFDQRVGLYNTKKERLLEEVSQRKALYERVRSTLAPATGLTVMNDYQFVLVPAWWLNAWVKGDASTLQHSGEAKATHSITESGSSGAMNNTNTTTNATTNAFSSTIFDLDAEEGTSEPNDNAHTDFAIVDMTNTDSLDPTTITAATSNTAVTTTKCAEINTTSYLCKHGTGLDTIHIERFKLISPAAYKAIFCSPCSWQQMNVVLDQSSFRCGECYSSVVQQRTLVQSLSSTYDHLIRLIDAGSDTSNSSSDDSVQYWLSKQWLVQLRKYHTSLQKAEPGKNKSTAYAKLFTASNAAKLNTTNAAELKNTTTEDVPVSTLDPNVNTNLLCPHKQPCIGYGKKAAKISEDAWAALLVLFPDALPILYGSEVCQLCTEEVSNNKESALRNKASRAVETESAALHSLVKMKRIYPAQLDEGLTLSADDLNTCYTQFCVIDGTWLAHWRKYIQDDKFPSPPPLTNAALKCNCNYSTSNSTLSNNNKHRALLPPVLSGIEHNIPPNTHDVQDLLVYKYTDKDLYELPSNVMEVECAFIGTNTDTNTTTGVYPRAEIITLEQWDALLSFHAPNTSNDVINLEDSNDGYSNVSPPSAAVYTLTLKYDVKKHTWHYNPSVCMECVEKQQLKAEHNASHYLSATLHVVYIRSESEFNALFNKPDPTLTTTNTTANTATTTVVNTETNEGERRSTRTRGKKEYKATIIADSSDTLSLVRLKVYQAFTAVDLPPTNQRLFDNKGNAISGQTKTLAECGVKIGDKLYVLTGSSGADGGGGEWEYSDFLSTHTSSRAVEQGFGGTLLLGSSGGHSSGAMQENSGTGNVAASAGGDGDDSLGYTSGVSKGVTDGAILTGLTRSSSGASHDSAVDLFQDRPFDSPVINHSTHNMHSRSKQNNTRTGPADSVAVNEADKEFQLQLARAMALSAREAETNGSAYEDMNFDSYSEIEQQSSEERLLQSDDAAGDREQLPTTQDSVASLSTTSDAHNNAGDMHGPFSAPATHTVKHKLYSLHELQQHKQQQSSEKASSHHKPTKKVRQEEKEEGEISTSAISTFGSDDETGLVCTTTTHTHQPVVSQPLLGQVAQRALLSPPRVPETGVFDVEDSVISANFNTQQSEEQQYFTANSTQDSAAVNEGEEQDTEPQFDAAPGLLEPTGSSAAGPAATVGPQQGLRKPAMKAISPAELMDMLRAAPSNPSSDVACTGCRTPEPNRGGEHESIGRVGISSTGSHRNVARGSSSNEPISLGNTPDGSPEK